MIEIDDFPLSPSRVADARRFYEAFITARQMFAKLPAKGRLKESANALHDLTLHLYQRGTKSDALFRASLGAADALAGIWLSQVRSVAQWTVLAGEMPPYGGVTKGLMRSLATLTVEVENVVRLPQILRDLGIILVHQPAIPTAKVDGCAFLLGDGRPVIALSLRYTRLDYYWFTVMHELAHLCLHEGQLFSPILDDLDEPESAVIEVQANMLARDSLIPRNVWRSCPAKYSLREEDVVAFADSVNVAPQIVAGRLRKELRRHDLFSGLVHQYNVREILNRDA